MPVCLEAEGHEDEDEDEDEDEERKDEQLKDEVRHFDSRPRLDTARDSIRLESPLDSRP